MFPGNKVNEILKSKRLIHILPDGSLPIETPLLTCCPSRAMHRDSSFWMPPHWLPQHKPQGTSQSPWPKTSDAGSSCESGPLSSVSERSAISLLMCFHLHTSHKNRTQDPSRILSGSQCSISVSVTWTLSRLVTWESERVLLSVRTSSLYADRISSSSKAWKELWVVSFGPKICTTWMISSPRFSFIFLVVGLDLVEVGVSGAVWGGTCNWVMARGQRRQSVRFLGENYADASKWKIAATKTIQHTSSHDCMFQVNFVREIAFPAFPVLGSWASVWLRTTVTTVSQHRVRSNQKAHKPC